MKNNIDFILEDNIDIIKPLTTVTGKTIIDKSKISPWNNEKKAILKMVMDRHSNGKV